MPAPPEDYEADIPGTVKQDVVGPVCESGDFLAKDRRLPPLDRGDLLAIFSAGRLRHGDEFQLQQPPAPPRCWWTATSHRLIRRRETFEDLVRPEIEV